MSYLRLAAPAVLAVATVAYLDFQSRRAGLEPPGFAHPVRRAIGLGAVGIALALACFAPLASSGSGPTAQDLAAVPDWQLFALHILLVVAMLTWYGAGFGGRGEPIAPQLGLQARAPWREIGFGVLFGIGAWVVVIVGAWAVAILVTALGGADLLPKSPSGTVVWLAGRSVGLRAGLALSAGLVEETFFRGLLQPRIGLVFATLLFALAHLSYGQPFLLVGITLLSLLYGLLVRWRQSVWAAIAAHAVFDLVQLLIVVPSLLNSFGGFWGS